MNIGIKALICALFMILTRKYKFNVVFYCFSAAHAHTFVDIFLGVNLIKLQVDGMSLDSLDKFICLGVKNELKHDT